MNVDIVRVCKSIVCRSLYGRNYFVFYVVLFMRTGVTL